MNGAGPAHMRWDTDGAQTFRCDLATATATRQEVVLNFGARREQEMPGETGAALLRRIALSPKTAKHLGATLRRLVDDYENSRPRR